MNKWMAVVFALFCFTVAPALRAEQEAPSAKADARGGILARITGKDRQTTGSKPGAKPQVGQTLKPPADPDGVVPAPEGEPDRIIVYYIHGGPRCPSCRKIESFTANALSTALAEPVGTGKIVWQPVNADVRGNEHFMKDYQLFTKSVVVVEVKDGKQTRWKNLAKVWELLGNQQDFEKYIVSEVRAYLN
jgi:hypothetical protein